MEEKKTHQENAAGEGANVPSQNGRKRRNRNRHRGGKNGSNGQNVQHGQNGQPTQNAQSAQTPSTAPSVQKFQQKQQGQGGQGQNQKPVKQKNKQAPQKNGQGNKNGGNDGRSGNQKEENRKDTYLYVLDGNLYVNLTNKCSNACDFCVRNERTSYYGNYLWLRHGDPTPDKVKAAANGMGDLTKFKEVVFCGFGEPTYRVVEMCALCDYFHEKGLKTRLNTNGQGNLINKRDIVPELKGKIDFVNVSLNASCYEKYQPICRSQFKEAGFASMIEFAKSCRRNGIACRFSIVDCIGEEEVEACKRLAQSVNVPLYVREYIADS